ncbi:unnamed protein product [Porites lobata]|uniref:Soluble interferon alpha/beta receptor OPG204 n=1 Tax=Porites lobata TaxID=104759 RepID=A0ABN8RDX0_9CNID|nr:unnamed protein product [Porites lobata]
MFSGVIQVEPADVRIISPTENQIIRFRNQSVLFNCTSSSRGKFDWLRNNNVIPNITQKDSSHWSSFELKSFSPQDEGVYMCINDAGTDSVKVYLASIPTVKQTGKVNIPFTKDEDAKVGCEARGWPRPEITWLRGNRNISDINQQYHEYLVNPMPRQDDRVVASELIILGIQKEDSGIYTCKATNALKVVTKNIMVPFSDPGGFKPTVTAEKGQYTVEVGKDVSLSCLGDQVKRDPFTWIYWEFNATKINTSTHHYNDSKKYSNPNDGTTPKVHMKLTIFNADHSDEGNYTCVVFSYQTRYSDGISLQVRAKKGNGGGNGEGLEAWLIGVLAVVAFLLILLLILVIVKRRRKIREKRLARLAQKYGQDTNYHTFEKDVFISYSSKDYDWVQEFLLPVFNNNNVNYTIHSRDFKPGKAFLDNMADSVYTSRKVILVMSANYLSSGFCKDEMHMALYRSAELDDASLILVKIDNTKIKDIPKSLRHKTFIDFTSREEVATWQNRILESVVSEDRSALSGTRNEYTDGTGSSDKLQLIFKFFSLKKKKKKNTPEELTDQA